MKEIIVEITPEQQGNFDIKYPYVFQIRDLLNKGGIKFKDDYKFSSIINKNPEPEGEVVVWKDTKSGSIFYKQIL